jgi:methylmalonyl-CoA/ethylmalonyl-CoA epimerase
MRCSTTSGGLRPGSVLRVAVLGVHHIGIAVDDLDAAVLVYEELFGAQIEQRETVESQGVEAASLRAGSGRIELLRPLGPDTPVGRFLAKRGPGMHHIAFEVDDVATELARLQADGAQLIDDRPRPGMFGLQVAFVHPEATGGVLAEFVSDDRD